MQTFLPYADFNKTAACLDRQRLGKQRVEALQILRTLHDKQKSGGWLRHPAVLMWRGYENALCYYGAMICREWIKRGYNDTCLEKIEALYDWSRGTVIPPWLRNTRLIRAYRSNLLRKNAEHYSQFGWRVPTDLEYVWPVKAEDVV